jgi:hypothetical protein
MKRDKSVNGKSKGDQGKDEKLSGEAKDETVAEVMPVRRWAIWKPQTLAIPDDHARRLQDLRL